MRARSMKRYGVRLSHSPTAAACGGFAAAGPAGKRYRSFAAAAACGVRMRAMPLCQRTSVAEHRFVSDDGVAVN